ncbi:hypothetical protein Glove_319g78 [Diversispora epigaea]|uniref:Acetyl-CoA carboxylase central domain-containing protein n=1 Tax=Diversispora epigaea TaxID=1348612 RepID=A0A397HVB8_9GLOM|nr:hypothetical protein Glove_319g78 [Diversispora epigaea]
MNPPVIIVIIGDKAHQRYYEVRTISWVFYISGKENSSDCRFFIRTLVRPGRLRSNVRTADYLISNRIDFLEIFSFEHKNSDRNHLFINFIVLKPRQVEDAVRDFIERHEKLLWRLCVTGAAQGNHYLLRVIINNVSGLCLRSKSTFVSPN